MFSLPFLIMLAYGIIAGFIFTYIVSDDAKHFDYRGGWRVFVAAVIWPLTLVVWGLDAIHDALYDHFVGRIHDED